MTVVIVIETSLSTSAAPCLLARVPQNDIGADLPPQLGLAPTATLCKYIHTPRQRASNQEKRRTYVRCMMYRGSQPCDSSHTSAVLQSTLHTTYGELCKAGDHQADHISANDSLIAGTRRRRRRRRMFASSRTPLPRSLVCTRRVTGHLYSIYCALLFCR